MLKEHRPFVKSVLLLAAFFLLLIITINVQAKEQGSAITTKDIKELAKKIKAAENGISNIKIESEAWVEEKTDLSDPCEPWKRTPTYISSTAWFDGNREGRARVDFHKKVLKWEKGAAPYLESNYSASFDGKHGRYIKNSTSHSGKVFHINNYSVLPDAPHELRNEWYQKMLGINASLNFHFSSEKEMFSSLFQYAIDPNSALKNAGVDPNFAVKKTDLEITFQELKDAECINISLKGKRSQESWWLDPNRGFALLKYENTRTDKDGREVPDNSTDVRRLDKVAENLWWPMEVYFISAPFEAGNPWKRIVYRATNVVANAPNFADSIFTPPIPEGYSVDKAEYKTIYTGQKAK